MYTGGGEVNILDVPQNEIQRNFDRTPSRQANKPQKKRELRHLLIFSKYDGMEETCSDPITPRHRSAPQKHSCGSSLNKIR